MLLVAHATDVNADDGGGRTAIMGASERGWMTGIKALLAKGADPRASDNNGRTTLGYAALAGKYEVVEYLLSLTTDK
jgi:ankyrin repeat protein